MSLQKLCPKRDGFQKTINDTIKCNRNYKGAGVGWAICREKLFSFQIPGIPPISPFPFLPPLSFDISGMATPVVSKGDKGSRGKEWICFYC